MSVSDFGFTTTDRNPGETDASSLSVPFSQFDEYDADGMLMHRSTPSEVNAMLAMGRRALVSAWMFDGMPDDRGMPLWWGALGDPEDSWDATTFPLTSPMGLLAGRFAIRDGDFQNGITYYTHVAYADNPDGSNSDGSPLSRSRSGHLYIGVRVDTSAKPSEAAGDYLWTQIKGMDSANGWPAGKNPAGKAQYLHLAFANSADGKTDFSTTKAAGRTYRGQYTDLNVPDSNKAEDYKWAKWSDGNAKKGYPAKGNVNGKAPYLHVATARSANGGNGFDHTQFDDRGWFGVYVDYSDTDSDNSSDYRWYSSMSAAGLSKTAGYGPNGANTNSRATVSLSGLSGRGLACEVIRLGTSAKNGGGLPFDLPYLGERGSQSLDIHAWDVQNSSVKTLVTNIVNSEHGPDLATRPYWSDGVSCRVRIIAGSDADIYLDMGHPPIDLTCSPQGGSLEDVVVDYQHATQRIYATGSGTDESVVTALSEDLSEITGRPDPPILMESNWSDTNVNNVSELRERTGAVLNANRRPMMQLSGVIHVNDQDGNGRPAHPLGSFWPGELFNIHLRGHRRLPDGVYPMRLMKMGGDQSDAVKLQFDVVPAPF
ncbi:MAG: hypothetical protein SOI13_01660 [Bifidobacterium mongoliense]